MMTDNQGFLTRVATSLPFADPFPNLTLQSDWDIMNVIIHSIRQLGTTLFLVHVKCQQDNSIPYEHYP
jgi:hypothetical protein